MVAVIVVGFNSQQYLDDCFSSVLRSNYDQYRIIFVDNNSTDQSVEYVSRKYPSVVIIQNDQNLGFARANNIGLANAAKIGAEYVLLLNPDTIIDEKCLFYLTSNPNPHTILQPLVLLYKNTKTSLINSAGNHLNFLGISYCGDYKKNRSSAKSGSIVSASGTALFAPIKLLNNIGGFDESFFMYHEDLDLCWRARMAGYQIKLVSDAIVWHKYHYSANPIKMYYFERNRIIFLFKNYEVKTLLLIAPALFLHELLVCAYAIKGQFLTAKLKSYASVVQLLPLIMIGRKSVKRVRGDHQLKKLINAQIQFEEVTVPLIAVYNKLLRGYWKIIFPLI